MHSIMQVIFFISLSSCIHLGGSEQNSLSPTAENTENSSAKTIPSPNHNPHNLAHNEQAWFKGSVAEAFATAKIDKKAMFLYWGAVWCPPCNELKSSVFNQARFWQEMESILAVYLDGDGIEAQAWGEKLDVSGYPTLLFLNDQGDEIFRLATGLSLEEMIQLLKYLNNDIPSIESTIAKLESGSISQVELSMLSYLSWEQKSRFAEINSEKLRLVEKIFETLPPAMTSEKAITGARLLEYWASTSSSAEKIDKLWAQSHIKKIPLWFASMTQNKQAIFASRATLIYSIQPIYQSMQKFLPKLDAEAYKPKWLAALRSLQNEQRLNIDAQFWARLGELGFYRATLSQSEGERSSSDKEQAVPEFLQKQVAAEVARIDKQAMSPEERIAVISGAGVALYQAGLHREAEQFLRKEAKNSPTPYYYYSALSSLAKKEKDISHAKEWAHLAKKAALGRSTKIQWTAYELNLFLEHLSPEKEQDMSKTLMLLDEYYQLAFSFTDGFQGRNGKIGERIAKNVAPFCAQTTFLDLINKYKAQCLDGTKETGRQDCLRHFRLIFPKDNL